MSSNMRALFHEISSPTVKGIAEPSWHRRRKAHAIVGAIVSTCLVLAGCSGGSSSSPPPTTPTIPTPTPPPAPTPSPTPTRTPTPEPTPPPLMQATIGPTGGNIATSGGAQIVIPEGALAADTMIGVEQTSTGAPPLPAGVKTFGPVVAFTPHGTSFALPATITVPFDATSVPTGTKLALVKTDDSQARWEVIGGARVNCDTISAPVVGFSYATVLADPSPLDDPPHLVTEEWHFENFFTGSTNPSKPRGSYFLPLIMPIQSYAMPNPQANGNHWRL